MVRLGARRRCKAGSCRSRAERLSRLADHHEIEAGFYQIIVDNPVQLRPDAPVALKDAQPAAANSGAPGLAAGAGPASAHTKPATRRRVAITAPAPGKSN
jgi:hypothetical protein